MECETEFAPSPLWSDASICAQAFNMLQNTHDSFETLGVRHALFFGTLLGAIRHGGPVMRFAYDRRCLFIPWHDDIEIIASKDDLTSSRCEQLDWLLARHGLARVPFFGGFKVFRSDTICDANQQQTGGYRYAWPFVSVYLFEERAQRVGTFWKRGIVVQGRAPWHARSGVQTQFFYDEGDVFPTAPYRFGNIARPLPLPRYATRLLAQDYGEQCFSDVLPPKRLCRENEVATQFAQEPTAIELVRALYATFGWQFCWKNSE